MDTTFATLTSLALVFIILVYVYPLRSMMGAALNVITNGWSPSDFQVRSLDELRGLFVIYGIGFALACAAIAVLNVHAYRQRERLGLTPKECYAAQSEYLAWALVGGVGVLSVILALVLPSRWIPLAGWSYSTLPIIMPLYSVVRDRGEPAR